VRSATLFPDSQFLRVPAGMTRHSVTLADSDVFFPTYAGINLMFNYNLDSYGLVYDSPHQPPASSLRKGMNSALSTRRQ